MLKPDVVALEPSQRPQSGKIGPPLLPFSQDIRNSFIKCLSGSAQSNFPSTGTFVVPFLLGYFVQRISQVQNGSSTHQRLLVIVTDVDVEDVNRSVERGTTVMQVVDDSIPAPLLTRDNHIHHPAFSAYRAFVPFLLMVQSRVPRNPILESLGSPLYIPVPGQHVQDAIVAVESRILRQELVVHLCVRCRVEGINVGLRNGRARKAYKGASAERENRISVWIC